MKQNHATRYASLLATLALILTATLTGCGTTNVEPSASESLASPGAETTDVRNIPVPGSRAGLFASVEDLLDGSELVVIGQMASPDLIPETIYGDEDAPFGIATVIPNDVLMGDHQPGEPVSITLESGIDEETGTLYTSRLSPEKEYLLFLTPVGDKLPDVYATTDYIGGVYVAEDDSGVFHVTDTEPTGKPATLTAEEVTKAIANAQ